MPGLVLGPGLLADHFLYALLSAAVLAGSGLGSAVKPLQLAPQYGREPVLLLLERVDAHLAPFQEIRVASVVEVGAVSVDFHDLRADAVQKIPVVCDQQDCERSRSQMAFQPFDGRYVQMVRRLVHQHDVRLDGHDPCDCGFLLHSAREDFHFGVEAVSDTQFIQEAAVCGLDFPDPQALHLLHQRGLAVLVAAQHVYIRVVAQAQELLQRASGGE